MRGFQKGITLGGWTSGSTLKLFGGWHRRLFGGGLLDFSVTQVQVFRLYFEFRLDFRLDLDFRLTTRKA